MTWNNAWTGWLAALAVAVMAQAGVWTLYRQERASHEQLHVVRGQAILAALEAGMRSHRRLNMWFHESIGATLEQTARTEGIKALGILDTNGRAVARGGDFPEDVNPSTQPQWTARGLIVSRQVRFDAADDTPPGWGSGGGRGWGRQGREGREVREAREAREADDLLGKPLWMVVILDDAPWRRQVTRDRRLAILLSAVSVAVIVLGMALIRLFQRQGRLGAELALARERGRRLEEMARLGAGLAHETKNPLSLIRGLAQSMRHRSATDAATRDAAAQIIDEADRVVGRINSFLTYSRPPSPRLGPCDLGATVSDAADLFRDEARARGVALRLDLPPLHVRADAGMIRQIVVNLMANALAACRDGDTINVGLRRDDGAQWALSVADTGEGIAPEDLPEVAKPYFSRREGGTGLGLAIVDQIAQAHGWRLAIASQQGRGTTVRIERIAGEVAP